MTKETGRSGTRHATKTCKTWKLSPWKKKTNNKPNKKPKIKQENTNKSPTKPNPVPDCKEHRNKISKGNRAAAKGRKSSTMVMNVAWNETDGHQLHLCKAT